VWAVSPPPSPPPSLQHTHSRIKLRSDTRVGTHTQSKRFDTFKLPCA
jgi:hypothetical protein